MGKLSSVTETKIHKLPSVSKGGTSRRPPLRLPPTTVVILLLSPTAPFSADLC
jgi:hypothetical protein